jgi:hypothetical protein
MMKRTQSKSAQINTLPNQNPQITELSQILGWRLYIINQSKRFFDTVFLIDTLKADTAAISISARTAMVLIFLRSFSAIFMTDILRVIFTALNMKNNINLGFLSMFVLRWIMVEGL